MKKSLFFILISSFGVGLFYYAAGQGQPQVLPTSFALTYEERAIDPLTAKVTWSRQKYFARRGDGARVSGPVGSTNVEAVREFVSPSDGLNVLISDVTRTKCTLYSPRAESHRPLSVEPLCEKHVSKGAVQLGIERMFGVSAVHYRTTTEGDRTGNTVESDIWLAPQLGCRAVKELSVKLGPDKRAIGLFERVAVNINLGEPDPSLFVIPEEYREVRPSEQNRLIHESAYPNRAIPASVARTMDVMDRRYEASQVHKR